MTLETRCNGNKSAEWSKCIGFDIRTYCCQIVADTVLEIVLVISVSLVLLLRLLVTEICHLVIVLLSLCQECIIMQHPLPVLLRKAYKKYWAGGFALSTIKLQFVNFITVFLIERLSWALYGALSANHEPVVTMWSDKFPISYPECSNLTTCLRL